MNICIRILFTILIFSHAFSALANPAFFALVKKAKLTKPGSEQWAAVEAALAEDAFTDIDWEDSSELSARQIIEDYNPAVLMRLRNAQADYDKLWSQLSLTIQMGSEEAWGRIEAILAKHPDSVKLNWKRKGRLSVRTLVSLHNQALYERVFGKPQKTAPEIWSLIVAATQGKGRWDDVKTVLLHTPSLLDHVCESGESVREIIRSFQSEFYKQRLNLETVILEKYDCMGVLGTGLFGSVKRAENRVIRRQLREDSRTDAANLCVAIKTLKKAQYECCKMKYPPREVELLQRIGKPHPHVLRLIETVASESAVYMVTELVDGGELFNYVSAKDKLGEDECRRLMRQLVSGVDYLHRCGVVHRDLKLENVFIDKKGNIKIGDLGLGAFYTGHPLKTFCGSPDYAAPEMFRGLAYGQEVDVWSLGVMLFIMATGYLPFNDSGKVCAIQYVWPSKMKFSAELMSLVAGVFKYAPSRINLSQMILDTWLNNGGKLKPIARQRTGLAGEADMTDVVDEIESIRDVK